MKLDKQFYQDNDVVELARSLLGCTIYTRVEGIVCSAIIAETEAYAGVSDRASHAWGARLTSRTSIMYEAGGRAYVYLCYGIHKLFNVVTGPNETPHAVLVRGVLPLTNLETMRDRLGLSSQKKMVINGPGKFSKAMGISMKHNGIDLNSNEIWIEKEVDGIQPDSIIQTSRIGVDYAGEDAKLPYRFFIDEYWKKMC